MRCGNEMEIGPKVTPLYVCGICGDEMKVTPSVAPITNANIQEWKESSKMDLTINGFRWLINEVAQKDMPNQPNDDEIVALGRTYTASNHIYMNKELSHKVFYNTLIHELTHAFISSYGFAQVDLSAEVMCDFMGCYAEQIVTIANDYMKQRKGE